MKPPVQLHHLHQQTEASFELLKASFDFLLCSASNRGHWNEPRSTALAAMCLQLREDGSSPWLKAVKGWILKQQICEGGAGGSWCEEIWDTAMCIIALKELEVSTRHESIAGGLKWIENLFSANGRNNWHDEPWETSWALMAVLRSGRTPKNIDVASAIKWLISLQDEEGKIISPHYTAYFLLIDYFSRKINLADDVREQMSLACEKCKAYLIDALLSSDDRYLWSGEAWSNGQILWSLCLTKLFPIREEGLVTKVVSWFEQNQTPEGNWSDIEDTASATLGLSELTKNLMHMESEIREDKRDVERDFENRLKKAVPLPKLSLYKPLFEKDSDCGYFCLNIKESTAKLGAAILGFLAVGLVGWLANLIGLYQALASK